MGDGATNAGNYSVRIYVAGRLAEDMAPLVLNYRMVLDMDDSKHDHGK